MVSTGVGGGKNLQGGLWPQESSDAGRAGQLARVLSREWKQLALGRLSLRLPRWLSGKESTCQCRKLRFDPWVGKIPIPVFFIHVWRTPWTEEPGGLQSMGFTESDTAEQLSTEHRLSVSPALILTLTLTLWLFGKLQGWTFYF